MKKINTESLTKIGGVQVEPGVTKIRKEEYAPGVYLIPIFIHEKTSLAMDSKENVGAINTDDNWMLYEESKHSEENFKAMTTEEFDKGLRKVMTSEDRTSGYILNQFNSLMSQDQYDRVGEILDSINLNSFGEGGIGVWMMSFSDPVSPLLRPIPEEKKVSNLNDARVRFYDKCMEFYIKNKGSKKDAEQLMQGLKPKDYEDRAAGFDSLYPTGKAPREND